MQISGPKNSFWGVNKAEINYNNIYSASGKVPEAIQFLQQQRAMEFGPAIRATSGSAPDASFEKCPTSDIYDHDTPRDAEALSSPGVGPSKFGTEVPSPPRSIRKTKTRAGKLLNRHDSLKESKVSASNGHGSLYYL